MSIRPVHRTKHVVDAEGGTTAGVESVVDVINTVDDPSLGTSNENETGSKVNGIYLRVEVLHSTGVGRANCYLTLYKNIGGNIGGDRPLPNAVGINDMKRYILHQEMIMMNGDAGNGQPRTLFNGVIKIPQGFKRNGPKDKLQVCIFTPTVVADWCLQCIYKEFK